MQTVFLVLLLIAAVVAANAVYARFNKIPAAFLQIAAGLALAFTPLYHNFELEPEVFLFVIISVLMFNDGQNTNSRKLGRHFKTTLSLAVALALITILLVGSLTHYLLPQFSLALALALGAIITPTDAVAVSSITKNVKVPTVVMETLENESLFNDASGIVAFNLAIATVMTGRFSLLHGIGNFGYVFFGGILFGLVLGFLIVAGRISLINMHVDAPSVIVPYTLLTPFVVYLLAEAIGVSGILAVVATGLLHGIQADRLRLTTSRLQIVTTTTWSVLASILNGIVFVLLGVSLPRVVERLSQRNTHSIELLVGVGAILYLLMTVARFLWTRFDLAPIRAWNPCEKTTNALIMALSGVHGTITLAMAFSLPLTLNGQAFPYRNDVIFIAAVVILISLIIPTFILPLALPSNQQTISDTQLTDAKAAMVNYAMTLIQACHGNNPLTSQVVMLLDSQRTLAGRPDKAQLSNLFDQAYAVEAQVIEEMVAHAELDANLAERYLRIASETRIRNQQSLSQRLRLFLKFLLLGKFSLSKRARQRRRAFHQYRKQAASHSAFEHASGWSELRTVEKPPYRAVLEFLRTTTTADNQQAVAIVRRAYDERHRRLSGARDDLPGQNNLLIEAFQLEYNFIQQQAYPAELSNQLYTQISTDQLVYLQSFDPE
ncbi:cation:proton antiporter [Lactiplantibacillus plajomi]|uniref:Cation:proton antiporter n=1 Tax=Lactiplantibacillus plajomi TaxID=1457217 RepID=A0ABV6K0F4_9LACO|nr:sodium:proton antiporter [Lactiplantibacillus plajomi]